MKRTSNHKNVIAVAAAIVLFFAFSTIVLLYNTNARFRSSLNESKLRSESLLSEKLSLEKQIDQFKKELSSLTGKNFELDKLLKDASVKIAEKESQLSNMVRENKKIKDLENELLAVKQLRDELMQEKNQLYQDLQKMKTNNEELDEEIAALSRKNKELEQKFKLLQALNADNFQVETLKGKKDKLTVNSKKAKKLNLSFDVPQNVAENINFKIITPSGKAIQSDDKRVSIRVLESDVNLTASLSPYTGNFEVSKRIEMSYKPKEKLRSGVYKIEVYDGVSYLGSCQLRLK